MTQSPRPYKKIAGNLIGLMVWHRLYLGENHLLQINSSGYQENYKRFYFSDIQSITIQKTQGRLLVGLLWGLVLAGCLGLWFLFFTDPPDSSLYIAILIILCILTTPVLFAFFYNILSGPMCRFHIRTAVQTDRIASLSRLPKALRCMATIKPLILQAQGDLTDEDRQNLQFVINPPPVLQTPVQPPPRPVSLDQLPFKLYLYLGILLVADLPLTALSLVPSPIATAPGMILFAGTIICCIVILIKQRRCNPPFQFRLLPWIPMILGMATFALATLMGIIWAFQGEPNRASRMANGHLLDDPFTLWTTIISTAANVMLGLYILIRWRTRWQKTVKADMPPPVKDNSNDNLSPPPEVL